LAFIFPWLMGFILLKLLPILASLGFSFTDFYALEPDNIHFIGLDNFARMFRDVNVGGSVFATFGFALIAIPAQLLMALAIAALLSSKRVIGKRLLRPLFFMPSIIPATAAVVAAFGFIDPDTGWLNRLILEPLGLAPFPGFFSEAGFNFLLTLFALWTIGPSFMIMLGAMQGVPQELYEAARVDGAGPVYRFLRITLPMISPAVLFSLIISLISVCGGVALLDQGNSFGVGVSAYDGYISNVIFSNFEIGYGASLAWAFFVLMIGIIIVLFSTSRRWVHYAEGEHTL
jgi:multiple sugar transport system permease protein